MVQVAGWRLWVVSLATVSLCAAHASVQDRTSSALQPNELAETGFVVFPNLRARNQTDNVRRDGCKPGYWGPNCKRVCASSACVRFPIRETDVGIVCDKESGKPINCDTCIPGFWGKTCELRCSAPNCIEDVNFAATCNKNDGTEVSCTQCKPGWVGSDCTTRIFCPAIPAFAHMHSNCEFEVLGNYNASCSFWCDDGFELSGSLVTHCTESQASPMQQYGEWSALFPRCEALPCDPVEVDGAAKSCQGATGSICKLHPDIGKTCVGAFRCTAREGLETGVFLPVSEPPTCTDLVECGQCDTNAECVTQAGRKVCACKSGFFGTGHVGSCIPCTPCEDGFRVEYACGVRNVTSLTSHDTICTDINECNIQCSPGQLHGCNTCSQRCINQPGFFLCACERGFRLSADGRTCVATTCRMHQVAHSRKACAGGVGAVCDMTRTNACAPGYRGSGQLVCDENGSWVGSAKCYPMYCSSSEVAHISKERPCKESMLPWDAEFTMAFGGQCTLQCERGYRGNGKLTCSACKGGVSFTSDAVCEPESCRDLVIAEGVVCSGIVTGERCVAGRDFICPPGKTAKGSAVCTPLGILKPEDSEPRCEEASWSDPCITQPCGAHECRPANNFRGYVCGCDAPLEFDATTGECHLQCPPPTFPNAAKTDCLLPAGFRRVAFDGKSASAVMVGQRVLGPFYHPAKVVCNRISYEGAYVWDEVPTVLAFLAMPTQRVEGDVVDPVDHHAMVHWVENVTASYFTFCFSDVESEPDEHKHDPISVNFVAFSHVFGAEFGNAAMMQKTYLSHSQDQIHKYVALQTKFAHAPLVLSSLVHKSTSTSVCDNIHCLCEEGSHNAAVVAVGEIFHDSFGIHYAELDRYGSRDPATIEQVMAQKRCGQPKCSFCQDSCVNELALALQEHPSHRCVLGKDASPSWMAIPLMQTSGLATGSTKLPYKRLSTDLWRSASNCFPVHFSSTIQDAVVLATINQRSGDISGSFAAHTTPAIAWHIEGVNDSGFRVCYKLLVERFDDQPQSQQDFVSVDWVAFHS